MPRITKVYTRTGDDGTTALGDRVRVPKTSPRIAAYGTVDELNTVIGVVLAARPARELFEPLQRIQNDLLVLGADLCLPDPDKDAESGPKIEARHVEELEVVIDTLNKRLEPLENFILPGGTPPAAHLEVARTVCRRAERDVLSLAAREPVSAFIVQYLNRLSDAFFVLSRVQNRLDGFQNRIWDSRA